jgi:4-alpha-glucanotransferase
VRRFHLDQRASGILLHITSLPGPYGCGDMGAAAVAFLEFLEQAQQRWWQMLPVGPIGPHGVPYSSESAFAGGGHLIDLNALHRADLLDAADLAKASPDREGGAHYGKARSFRDRCLRRAFQQFSQRGGPERVTFTRFCADNAGWLDDYALFTALKHAHDGRAWDQWEKPLRLREPAALGRVRTELKDSIDFERFVQYTFAWQWRRLRNEAHRRGVALIGDLPFFVSYDSADVWTHQRLFRLDDDGRPIVVSGVPPDYFSETGQRWGHPHYAWDEHEREGFRWWVERLRRQLTLFDAVRLDHFIALVRHWDIPAESETAEGGRWSPGPGATLLEHIFDQLGEVQLIAEDLGSVTDAVHELCDRFGLPGMRVLQFGFSNDDDFHLPHRYVRRCVVYPGTHDNNTSQGWWREKAAEAGSGENADETELGRAKLYLGATDESAHRELIRAAMTSVADLAIIPAQDLLGLGEAARMNNPGGGERNWRWRLRPGQLTEDHAEWLRRLTQLTGRAQARGTSLPQSEQ